MIKSGLLPRELIFSICCCNFRTETPSLYSVPLPRRSASLPAPAPQLQRERQALEEVDDQGLEAALRELLEVRGFRALAHLPQRLAHAVEQLQVLRVDAELEPWEVG